MNRGIVIFIGLLLTGSVFSQEGGKNCKGIFRWEVKTLTDIGGQELLSAGISDSALSQLVSVHPPKHFFVLSKKDGRLPRYPTERQLVRVVAIIKEVKTQADQDLHIVLKSPDSGDMMIGEIPDPECRIFDSLPELRTVYLEARRQLQQATDMIKATDKPVLVEITGVPFWDARHWWLRGCAHNGREIHPILSVKILER